MYLTELPQAGAQDRENRSRLFHKLLWLGWTVGKGREGGRRECAWLRRRTLVASEWGRGERRVAASHQSRWRWRLRHVEGDVPGSGRLHDAPVMVVSPDPLEIARLEVGCSRWLDLFIHDVRCRVL